MTLPKHALQYSKCSKEELRTFVMQRQNLSGREYTKSSKKHLVRRLLRLDQIATFRLFDLPPEIRENCFQNAVACASDFRRLSLASKQVHPEVRSLFYKNATFELGPARRERLKKATGNPMFGLCTQYWNHVAVHENPLSLRFADTFYLQHHMFCNIRHLSLKGEMVEEMIGYGAPLRFFRVGRSRELFMTCVFYAFNDVPTQLKTLTYHVECHRPPHMLSAEGLLMTLWPLKLLAGRVKVQFRSMRKELVNRIHLHKMDLGFQLVEACRRFARCYFSHDRPSVGKSNSLEATRAIIYREKMAELAAFNTSIFTPDAWMLVDFVKRMEWMELEYLDHAEDERSRSLTRAWIKTNGSPPQRP
jgi:hypothetical protein